VKRRTFGQLDHTTVGDRVFCGEGVDDVRADVVSRFVRFFAAETWSSVRQHVVQQVVDRFQVDFQKVIVVVPGAQAVRVRRGQGSMFAQHSSALLHRISRADYFPRGDVRVVRMKLVNATTMMSAVVACRRRSALQRYATAVAVFGERNDQFYDVFDVVAFRFHFRLSSNTIQYDDRNDVATTKRYISHLAVVRSIFRFFFYFFLLCLLILFS